MGIWGLIDLVCLRFSNLHRMCLAEEIHARSLAPSMPEPKLLNSRPNAQNVRKGGQSFAPVADRARGGWSTSGTNRP